MGPVPEIKINWLIDRKWHKAKRMVTRLKFNIADWRILALTLSASSSVQCSELHDTVQ